MAGNTVLFTDVLEVKSPVFRLFPDFSVNTAVELVGRLLALETKTIIYRRENYLLILDLQHGKAAFDIIRSDLGLPPNQYVN